MTRHWPSNKNGGESGAMAAEGRGCEITANGTKKRKAKSRGIMSHGIEIKMVSKRREGESGRSADLPWTLM